MIGNAVRGAAAAALEKWRDEERLAKAEYTYLAPKTTQIDPHTGDGDPNFAYGYVAIAAEVVVDSRTDECTYPRIACANDVGQAINPRMLEGQIEGGVVQAFGWATTENFIQCNGYPLTNTLSTYLIPTIEDIPQRVLPIIIENAAPTAPGARAGWAKCRLLPLQQPFTTPCAAPPACGTTASRSPWSASCVACEGIAYEQVLGLV